MKRIDMTRVCRALATILPALLGQGLIYLCIDGEISVATAIVSIVAMSTVVLVAASLARDYEEQQLVSLNRPPAYLLHRAQHASR